MTCAVRWGNIDGTPNYQHPLTTISERPREAVVAAVALTASAIYSRRALWIGRCANSALLSRGLERESAFDSLCYFIRVGLGIWA